jgi:hypothetical protein
LQSILVSFLLLWQNTLDNQLIKLWTQVLWKSHIHIQEQTEKHCDCEEMQCCR